MILACHKERPQIPLDWLCSTLGVSRSWLYAQAFDSIQGFAASEAGFQETVDPEEVALRHRIEQIVLKFSGYGYRRVTRQLQREGWNVNHKRVLRIMREESLLCQLKKRFVLTTDSGHGWRTYPNLLKEMDLTRLNQAWQADITYIRLPGGFCYLAAILDAFSRYCVGWHLSREIDTQLTLAALDSALACRQPAAGLVHHSDQGVQYAAADYVLRLEAVGARISMSAKGNPYDNAKAESFFKTLKREEVHLKEYRTFDEARENIGPFITDVYNHKRLHSALNYLPPAEFEAHYSSDTATLA
jgi:transposase InsO family protein